MAAEQTPELITSAQAIVRFWNEFVEESCATGSWPMPDGVVSAVMGAVAEAAVEDGLCIAEPAPTPAPPTDPQSGGS